MASAKDKRGGRAWSREEQHSEREVEASLRMDMSFVMKHCNIHSSQNICEQYGANPAVHVSNHSS